MKEKGKGWAAGDGLARYCYDNNSIYEGVIRND